MEILHKNTFRQFLGLTSSSKSELFSLIMFQFLCYSHTVMIFILHHLLQEVKEFLHFLCEFFLSSFMDLLISSDAGDSLLPF